MVHWKGLSTIKIIPRISVYTFLFEFCRMSSNDMYIDLSGRENLYCTLGYRTLLFICASQPRLCLNSELCFLWLLNIRFPRVTTDDLQNHAIYRDKSTRNGWQRMLFKSLSDQHNTTGFSYPTFKRSNALSDIGVALARKTNSIFFNYNYT